MRNSHKKRNGLLGNERRNHVVMLGAVRDASTSLIECWVAVELVQKSTTCEKTYSTTEKDKFAKD